MNIIDSLLFPSTPLFENGASFPCQLTLATCLAAMGQIHHNWAGCNYN